MEAEEGSEEESERPSVSTSVNEVRCHWDRYVARVTVQESVVVIVEVMEAVKGQFTDVGGCILS